MMTKNELEKLSLNELLNVVDRSVPEVFVLAQRLEGMRDVIDAHHHELCEVAEALGDIING